MGNGKSERGLPHYEKVQIQYENELVLASAQMAEVSFGFCL